MLDHGHGAEMGKQLRDNEDTTTLQNEMLKVSFT